MPDGVCGAECADGTPCQHPAGSCPVPSHSDPDADNHGRPAAFDDEWRREVLYDAVGIGMKITHQAGIAQVSENTLRRALCCIDTPSDPVLTADEPCDFCRGYVRAHSEGAMKTLQNCKDEFIASATFGYKKTEGREVTGADGGPIAVEFNETVHDTDWEPPADTE